MNKHSYAISVALTVLALGQARAQTQNTRDALDELPALNGAQLSVATRSWQNGGDIPLMSTQYGNNAFPGLTWSSVTGAKTYAVIVQDTDASQNSRPILHFTLYDIPPDATRLNVGMVPGANPRGSHYGPNYKGSAEPYLGPHPPPGPKHHYHFQVFALDTDIPSSPAPTYDELLNDMRGHVLASGEVVGLSQAAAHAASSTPSQPVDPFFKN